MPSIRSRPQLFLSTLPARGATRGGHMNDLTIFISIHAPREGSDPWPVHPNHPYTPISIHAPREGSDP